MTPRTYKVVVAIPSTLIQNFVEAQIRKTVAFKSKLILCSDVYTLPDVLKSEAPDIVITSPNVIGDVALPLLKERLGLLECRFIVVCAGVFDEHLVRNYDGKFMLTDKENDFIEGIEKLLYEEQEEQEDLKENALTPREKDIVVCVVKGMTNKEIAAELYLSTHTVITHRRNIAKKLQIHSPAGLTIYAIVNNLVELSDIKDI
ncbi:response regulator transcription factor [Porphyromonas sp.]|uniref:response regulator transcription factor n=1 Tax=Porphyromonas sp. TaxID=1924944 RepID=UPI0026DD7397|nr:helix-turn-helix transcriptional regulator [Porphyromonas sp.]MDO4695840.1 helix-turn-helix transcriptional regulator [Porphyromonas sp.]MDO4771402.1 helix-turn-helix transcriptional regulator [Porphyromonas sp.]